MALLADGAASGTTTVVTAPGVPCLPDGLQLTSNADDVRRAARSAA